MQTISKRHPKAPRGARANLDLVAAYRNLFLGTDEGKIILADLAVFSQFNLVPGVDETEAALRYANGRKSVFAHILNYLRMTDAEIVALEEAARYEGMVLDRDTST